MTGLVGALGKLPATKPPPEPTPVVDEAAERARNEQAASDRARTDEDAVAGVQGVGSEYDRLRKRQNDGVAIAGTTPGLLRDLCDTKRTPAIVPPPPRFEVGEETKTRSWALSEDAVTTGATAVLKIVAPSFGPWGKAAATGVDSGMTALDAAVRGAGKFNDAVGEKLQRDTLLAQQNKDGRHNEALRQNLKSSSWRDVAPFVVDEVAQSFTANYYAGRVAKDLEPKAAGRLRDAASRAAAIQNLREKFSRLPCVKEGLCDPERWFGPPKPFLPGTLRAVAALTATEGELAGAATKEVMNTAAAAESDAPERGHGSTAGLARVPDPYFAACGRAH